MDLSDANLVAGASHGRSCSRAAKRPHARRTMIRLDQVMLRRARGQLLFYCSPGGTKQTCSAASAGWL
jgi:hypothetical protein